MDGVWRSSIHHMPIPNAVPLYLHQYHPSLWRPTVVKSCRARVPCSVSSHVLPLKPLDTCQKHILVPIDLDIGQFIALLDCRTFKWLALLCFVRLTNKKANQNHSSKAIVICYLFPPLSHNSLPLQRTHHKNTSAAQNWLHSLDIIKITNSPFNHFKFNPPSNPLV